VCGIAGRFNYRSLRPVDEAVVRSMADLLAHRGPDGEGVYARGDIGLAHRRLAIVDLTSAGSQPMKWAEPGTDLWISFNGEIYNFPELRLELEARGHRFRSRTDTEVILAAWREYGVECLQRLRGMFAFALWDGQSRSLLIARDRIGKKPLHYTVDSDGIAFASEPKAFLADPAFVPEVDHHAIAEYLALQSVPSPLSAFKGVSKLPPAHYLLIERGSLTVERYWRLHFTPKRALPEEEASTELLAALRDAVKTREISDVPIGAFLSGGIDSATVVALMAEGAGRVKTFSIGFEEQEYDELRFARLVAERYATDHHEFVVRPSAVDILPQLVWHYNEPYADPSAIPTWYVSQLTRRHVTVALNGDGGDENFAGYDRYLPNERGAAFRLLPPALRRLLRSAVPRRSGTPHQSALPGRVRDWLEARDTTWEERHALNSMQFRPALLNDLCTPEFLRSGHPAAAERLVSAARQSDASTRLEAMLDVDQTHYLPDTLLVKVDIASMAHSLEARSPLLDHRLMEFSARLPADLKMRQRTQKYLLKQCMRPFLPSEILDRPKKGFSVPLKRWLRGELKEMLSDLLLSVNFSNRGYFNIPVVRQLVAEHLSGARDWQDQLWNLLMLELWHRTYIDGAWRSAAGHERNLRRERAIS
jgi:asparagine synthase (glutamine-hydrolysing)